MSLVNLAHLCSHLQNASKARLGLTSVPLTKMHLNLALSLQKQGFISSVTLGSQTPPPPVPQQPDNAPTAGALLRTPWLAYPSPATDFGTVRHHKIPANPAKRRLWLGLKYWDSEPVLRVMRLVSRPSQRITMDVKEMRTVALGEDAGYVEGVRKVGECVFLSTDQGILELRECLEKRAGGLVLCRVSG